MAAFDVTGRRMCVTSAVRFHFTFKNALQEVVSSTVTLETEAAWNILSITVSTVAVAQLPYQLN